MATEAKKRKSDVFMRAFVLVEEASGASTPSNRCSYRVSGASPGSGFRAPPSAVEANAGRQDERALATLRYAQARAVEGSVRHAVSGLKGGRRSQSGVFAGAVSFQVASAVDALP